MASKDEVEGLVTRDSEVIIVGGAIGSFFLLLLEPLAPSKKDSWTVKRFSSLAACPVAVAIMLLCHTFGCVCNDH